MLGGSWPDNDVVSTPPSATIELTDSPPQTGYGSPYSATVDIDMVEVDLYRSSGYIPQSAVLYSSSDCGNRGQLLDCTIMHSF